VVEGAGHSPHLTHGDVVLAAISGFVGRILALEAVPAYKLQNNA